MPDSNFLFAHLSDLHFSHGTDKSNPDHSHSIQHLKGLEESLPIDDLDLLVISGDISNHGDKQSGMCQ